MATKTQQNLLCGTSPRWQATIAQKWRAFQKGSWSYACVKNCVELPVKYTHSVMHWPPWLHDTLLCVLIVYMLTN